MSYDPDDFECPAPQPLSRIASERREKATEARRAILTATVDTPKFAVGDRVRLSKEGRAELRNLSQKRGKVVGFGPMPFIVAVEWGRYRMLYHNHEDNLEVVAWNE